MQRQPRRAFLQKNLALATTAILDAKTLEIAKTLKIGFIGPGGMGTNHLKLLVQRKDISISYICDPDSLKLANAVKLVQTASGIEPKAVKDMRQIFDDKSIDAVWIATPDHWHGPATILACEAGKHVYVEKPCSHNIREGRLMVEAARKNKCIVQVGTQSRSTPHILQAMKKIQEGAIGEVLVSKAWNSQLRRDIGKQKSSNPPPNLDYDLWTGPAPLRPYQSNLLPGIWRWWLDFGTGDAGNDGVHEIDIARWGLGVNTHPSNIAALGGKNFFKDDQQFPDTMYCAFDYPKASKQGFSKQLIYEHRIWSPYIQEGFENGNAFYGTNGMMILGKNGGWQLFGPKNKLIDSGKGSSDVSAHHQNFIDCIFSGKTPNGDIAEGHLSASLAHLANIACRLNKSFSFDPTIEKITDLPLANKLVGRTYREGGHWAIPKGV